ncbi:MAG TPA: NYN domain-containing protein [Anaerolineales bacterium]|nr:NYN domain-containing protein [Anaerolineales bacterium]
MPYLIDGHNLIPKFGIDLSAEDDEYQLVQILQNFARVTRKTQIEVYFDRRANHPDGGNFSSFLKVTFVKSPKLADQALAERLKALGSGAKNWTVVSSDNYIQREAKNRGATSLSSEEFAAIVNQSLRIQRSEDTFRDNSLTQKEVEDWLNFFNNKNKDQD